MTLSQIVTDMKYFDFILSEARKVADSVFLAVRQPSGIQRFTNMCHFTMQNGPNCTQATSRKATSGAQNMHSGLV